MCDVSEKRKLKSIEKLIGYSLYAKVLNSSETLLISNVKKNTNKLDKINIKNELNVNKEVKKTKKDNKPKMHAPSSTHLSSVGFKLTIIQISLVFIKKYSNIDLFHALYFIIFGRDVIIL